MDQIPDSISFSTLRSLHKEKAEKINFDSPLISEEIGDLAFLVDCFINHKVGGSMSHQQIFLADVVVTNLACSYEKAFKEACQKEADPGLIEKLAKFTSYLKIAEGILDTLVNVCMQLGNFKKTLPSYKLVRSLDPSVKPHEIEDWVRSLHQDN